MQDYRKHYQLFVSNSVIFQRALNIMNDNLKSTNRCSFQLNAEDIKKMAQLAPEGKYSFLRQI
jgi:hypothetical protein